MKKEQIISFILTIIIYFSLTQDIFIPLCEGNWKLFLIKSSIIIFIIIIILPIIILGKKLNYEELEEDNKNSFSPLIMDIILFLLMINDFIKFYEINYFPMIIINGLFLFILIWLIQNDIKVLSQYSNTTKKNQDTP